jgi:hypothetical protein
VILTLRASEAALSRDEHERLERSMRSALEPFSPRVSRTTASVRREGRASGRWRAVVSVSLGTAGHVRAVARAEVATACAGTAIRRAADAVARRLAREREGLLEFLSLANGAGRAAWPASPRARGRRHTPLVAA